MDATIEFARPPAPRPQGRYHLLVGPNGWLGDEWFPDVYSAVARAHAIEASRLGPGAGWQVKDPDLSIVASSEREAAETDRRLVLLFLVPVIAAFAGVAAYLVLA
jgi:hypothetical protein